MDAMPAREGLDLVADGPIVITAGQARFLSWMADVLIYVVVINLFVEYAPSVIIESFTISLLTAILLKLMLDSIVGLEHRVRAWFGRRRGAGWRILGLGATWGILFLSKFVIIEITHLIFSDSVQLGGFIDVVVLVIAMIAARRGLGLVYSRLLGPSPLANR
jgi:hypothetical protein